MEDWVNVSFGYMMRPSWSADEEAVSFRGKKYPYSKMTKQIKVISKGTLTVGNILVYLNGMPMNLTFTHSEYPLVEKFVSFANNIIEKNNIEQHNAEHNADISNGLIYDLTGARGRSIKVFEDKAIITVKATMGSLLTGNVTDGSKTIYYSDVIGVQYKTCTVTLGYLQLETASTQMNNKDSNFFSENSFTFNADLNDKMVEVSNYVKERVEYFKNMRNNPQQVVQTTSAADELLKFKQLLDMGAISQEEFDAKKKQILGL